MRSLSLFLFALIALPQFAAAQVSLTLGDATLAAGDSGAVSATISTDGSAVALQFDVLYDPAIVSLGTVNGGAALTGNHSISSNPIGPGRDRVVITTSPVTALGSGTLATINLSIAGSAGAGSTSLTWDGVVISDAAALPIIPNSLTPGTITITAGPVANPPTAIPASPLWSLLLLIGLLIWFTSRVRQRLQVPGYLSVATLLVLLVAPLSQAQNLPGDANGDGRIDIDDVRLIVERILERGTLPGDGDCNRDSLINVLDTVCSQIPFVPGETAPIILGPGDRAIPAGNAFEMNLFAADPDAGSTLSWELLSGPIELTVSSVGVLSWTPAASDAGDNPISIRVIDDTARTDEADFDINVFLLPAASPTNAAPVLTLPVNQALPIGTPLSAQASATDPDPGDTLTYRLINGPAGMTIDPNNGVLSWTPQANQARTADVVVEVSDAAGAVDFDSFTVTATEINTAPTAADDVYIARRGETLVIPAPEGVLQNDRDPQGDALAGTRLSDPSKGSIDAFSADGSFSYTPVTAEPITLGLVEKCRTAARVSAGTMSAADVDGDGDVELVALVAGGRNRLFTEVFIVDPSDCSSTTASISEDLGAASVTSLTTLVNLDDDPELELVSQYSRFNTQIPTTSFAQALYAVNLDGSQLANWPASGLSEVVSFPRVGNAFHQNASPVPVDLDGDGDTELIVGFTNVGGVATFNNSFGNAVVAYDGRTGEILWEYIGGITRTVARAVTPTIVDLDMDGDTEIIWNQLVLDHEGNLLFELPVEQTIPGGGSDFLNVAIANFDNDAFPEILGIDASNFYLFSHDGAVQWQVPYDTRGLFAAPYSDITVAELDGDPFPEFVMMLPSDGGGSADRTLRAFDSDGQPLWDQVDEGFVVETLTESRSSTPVAFDFDNDGIDELIQFKARPLAMPDGGRQQGGLYIINGETGAVITFQPGVANNNYDQALTVADVDGDGSAEIITNMATELGADTVQIWDNLPGEPFPPARGIRSGTNSHPTWINVDGSLPTSIAPHWLQPGRNGWHMIQPDIDPLEPERDSFTYSASDGEFDSAIATVNIEVRPAGNPPFFLSEPATGTSRGVAYEYTPLTVDIDSGDSVSYELINGPAGMTMNPTDGTLNWYPEAIGEYPVSIIASDTLGLSTAQIFRIAVGDPVVVPDVVGSSEGAAESALTGANLGKGSLFVRSHPTIAAGTVIEQNPIAGAAADFGALVELTLSSGPGFFDRDDDGDGFSENQGDCEDGNNAIFPGAADANGDGIDQDCDGIDGNKTLVAIEITPGSKRVLTNQPTPLIATGIFDDGTAQNLTDVATWTRGPTFFSASAGDFIAQASLRGVTGTADFNVVDRVEEDIAPLARIDTPTNGDAITAPVEITGSALDTNLLRWELAYQYAGEDEFIQFAEGFGNRRDAPIAELDPTTLLNGLYTVRLRVYDRGGNVTEDRTTVQVEGKLKVGNFSLRYVDLELPLNGIPITLARTYDSRDKRVGDFGIGWRLVVNSIEIRTNRELGSGWRVFRQGLTYGVVEDDVHIAAIRLPDGRIEAFEMVVGPDISPIVPFPPFSQSVSFRPLQGTLGSLESLEENNVSILDAQPGPVSLRLDSNGDVYNPTLFRYTTPDGTKIDLDTVDGIQRAETPGGQVLTFTPTSITHSNGTVVDIERDPAGRVTMITDPGGFTQSYTYDANGDLRAHNDQEDFVTRFDYDDQHNIINITDPLNRTAVRNEYDNQGRLISATNANGETVRFAHDVASRQEVITDPDGFVTTYDYDMQGNILTVTDPLGGVTTNTFDSQQNLLSTTNAAGETTTFTYNNRRGLLSVTDPLGATTTYTYDDRDQRVSTRDPLGRITRYEYDDASRRVAVIDPLGVVTRRDVIDADGNIVASENGRGNLTRFEYDAQGYRTDVIDAAGNRAIRTVNSNGHIEALTNARGATSNMDLDGRGLPNRVAAPAGNTMSYLFNGVGELISVSDELGNSSLTVVDAAGRMTRFEDPDGHANQMRFDGRGNRTSVIDASGLETRYVYDGLGRPIRVILPGGGVSETAYDSVGRMLTSTDPNGNVTSYEYDAAGRNTAVTDALGNRTEFRYDLVGNLIARLDARGNTTVYQYDALDRLIATEYPDGTTEVAAYDEVGNVISETDRLGRSKSYRYDAIDNLLSVTDTDGSVTVYSYDANNNRVSYADANGHTTRMAYDDNDRLIEKRYPDGSTERFEYDAGNHITRRVLPDGKYINTTQDGFGRPTGHDLNGEGVESFTYDAAGRITQAVNLWGAVAYSYDGDGRVSEILSEGGHAVRYRYDDLGNRTEVSTQLSGQPEHVTAYSYDALNRLATIEEPDGDTTVYAYDPVGNVASITYPNGVVSSFTYDNVNQLTRVAHRQGAVTLADYHYTLDAGGRRVRVDHANGDSVAFSYDTADRLLRETHRNAGNIVIFEQTFSYDAVGNRLTQQITGQAQTILAYDSADKLLTAGAARFAYDANGRLISKTAPQGTVSYSYDVEGQLLRVSTSTGSASYDYDASGKRRLRTVPGGEQNFLIDERSPTGYDQTLVVFDGSNDQLVEYHWGDRLISADDGSSDRFYHFDASKNTRLLTDDAGDISDTYDYDAFGVVRNQTGVADSPFGFAGEWREDTDGLVFLRARYYDPETGRFISRDPYAGDAYDPVSLHRYLYANANPIMNTDPSGQLSLLTQVSIGAAIGFGIGFGTSLIAGDSFTTALGKGIIGAVFGAGGALLGAGGAALVEAGASWAGLAAAQGTSRLIVAGAHAFAQGLINAVWGVVQLASTIDIKDPKNNAGFTKAEAIKLFMITFVMEFVTRGLWQPAITREVPIATETRSIAAGSALKPAEVAESALRSQTKSGGRKLFSMWDGSEDAVTFVERIASSGTKSGPRSAALSIKASLDQLSEEAEFVVMTKFVDELNLFGSPEAAGAFIEGMKGIASPLIDAGLAR